MDDTWLRLFAVLGLVFLVVGVFVHMRYGRNKEARRVATAAFALGSMYVFMILGTIILQNHAAQKAFDQTLEAPYTTDAHK